MPHPIWTGTLAFGLLRIPVKVYTAVRSKELHFHFLHKADEGRIQNVRRCSLDGQDVPYEDVVRGYEYEKGRYVLITDEELERMHPEATQTVDIMEFVDVAEIDPMYFDAPYYLEPEEQARNVYALLREALAQSGKIGIAKVVLRSREHLAALKADGQMLTLDLMHFADEIVEQAEFDLPEEEPIPEKELNVARMLIEAMTAPFDPEKFRDTYREALWAMIQARAAGKALPKAASPKPLPIPKNAELIELLQQSLEHSGKPRRAREGSASGREGRSRRSRERLVLQHPFEG